MIHRRSLPLRSSALLALVACVVGCGVVYTGDQPLWYVDCSGVAQDCTCDTSSYAFTPVPDVERCSAASAAGICCSNGFSACLCKAVRCVDTGTTCQCAFWPKAIGSLTDCGVPLPGQSCCMDASSAICTCAPGGCAAGTSPVPSCSPQYFTCDLLMGSEPDLGAIYDTPVTACSDGPIDSFDPCSGGTGCSE